MDSRWKKFSRVLRAYTIEEKVMSVIIVGMVVFLSLQSVVDLFKSGVLLEGGTYTEALISDKSTILNPLFVDFSESNRDISALVFSGLTKYDPDKKAFVDDMATLKISPERTIYKFFLKKNLQWHDGKPLTSDDVYFTFHDLIQNPEFKHSILHANFDGIQINKIDAQTIEFKLKQPNAFFITNMNIGILPQHILGKVPVKDLLSHPFNIKPIGSGPYRVDGPMESFNDGKQRIALNKFDGYYGDKPEIKQIRFNVYPDEESLLKEKNSLDIISKLPSARVEELKKDQRFSFSSYELPQYTAVFFNMEKPLLKKERVRLALLKAIDKNELLKLFRDKIAVDTPLLELNQAEWIYKANIKEAQGALFDAGYKFEPNKTSGVRKDSKGNALKFVLLVRAYDQGTLLDTESRKVVGFLKTAWANIGVEIDPQFAGEEDFKKRLASRNYDLILTGQGLGYNLDTYAYWHLSQASPTGYNLSNYRSFAASQLIENIRDTFDPTEKNQKLKDLAKVLADDIPAIFLYRPAYMFVNDGKVKGLSLSNLAFPSDRFAHVERWRIR